MLNSEISPVKPAASVDRKSTRLNSSHLVISYAVFCLKKKKTEFDSLIVAHHHAVLTLRGIRADVCDFHVSHVSQVLEDTQQRLTWLMEFMPIHTYGK